MRSAWQTVLIIVGLLLSTGSFADDAGTHANTKKWSSVVALSMRALHAAPEQTSRWQPLYDADSFRYPDIASQAVVNLDFENGGPFARVRKIRALSLLTLAEVKGARLFFGVNNKGLVGIHVRAVKPYGDDSCLEIARMPYLADIGAVNYVR